MVVAGLAGTRGTMFGESASLGKGGGGESAGVGPTTYYYSATCNLHMYIVTFSSSSNARSTCTLPPPHTAFFADAYTITSTTTPLHSRLILVEISFECVHGLCGHAQS